MSLFRFHCVGRSMYLLLGDGDESMPSVLPPGVGVSAILVATEPANKERQPSWETSNKETSLINSMGPLCFIMCNEGWYRNHLGK